MKSSLTIANKLIRNLMAEHVMIFQALNVLRIVTERVEKRRPVELHDLRLLCRFIADYADKIHHHAEEELLFDSLAERAPRTIRRMMEQLTTQHVMGRFFTARMAEAVAGAAKGERGWRKKFVGSAQSYDVLLTCHICSEDHNVFPAINRLIDRRGLRVKSESRQIRQQKDRLEKLLRRMVLRYSDMVSGAENIHQCERTAKAL